MSRRAPWRSAAGAALVAVAGLAALGSTGCATGGVITPRTAEQQATELQRLKDRVLELQRRLSVTEVELERLRREVARLGGSPVRERPVRPPATVESEQRVSEQRSAARERASADRGFEVEDIEDEPIPPAVPPPAVEETASGPVRVLPPAPDAGRGRAAEPADAEAEEPGAAPAVEAITAEAQSLYDRGYTLYHQGRFVDAESAFQRFLQAHSRTELADNAQYWIGEARLARGDLAGALRAFQETAQRFPDGNKVPDALLKAGETQASQGDVAGARRTYQEVVRRFAGTTAAAVAGDRLAELK